MEKFNERDFYLDKEKEIIKDLIISKIKNDGHQELLELYLRQTMKVNNELVREYFDSEEGKKYNPNYLLGSGTIDELLEQHNKLIKPVDGIMNDSFYDCFYNYINLSNLKEKLKENYSVDADLESREREILFVTNYNISKRLNEITDWYFNTIGDTTHNIDKFADLVTYDSRRVFALRNELTNRDLGLDFEKDNLYLTDNRAYLLAMVKMRLVHDYTLANIRMIKDLDDAAGKKDATSGTLLFHLLNTAAFISVMKELGYTMDELKTEDMVRATTEAIANYPEVYNKEESILEASKLIENAEKLADQYLSEKTK